MMSGTCTTESYNPRVIEPCVVLGHVLAVVTEQDDHRLVQDPDSLQIRKESPDFIVQVRHLGVVEIGDVRQIGKVIEMVVQVLCEEGIRRPILQLRRDERVLMQRRRPGVAVLVGLGRDVGNVRVPKVQKQEERLLVVFVQPLGPDVDDDRARRPRAARRRHVIGVAPHEPVLHRKEMIDGAGRVVGLPEDGRQPRHGRVKASRGVKMRNDARVDPESSGKDRRMRGLRRNVRRKGVGAECTLPGDTVEVGSETSLVTKASETICSQCVHRNKDDVHFGSFTP